MSLKVGMGQIIPLNHLYKPLKIIIAIYPTMVGDIQDSAGRCPQLGSTTPVAPGAINAWRCELCPPNIMEKNGVFSDEKLWI